MAGPVEDMGSMGSMYQPPTDEGLSTFDSRYGKIVCYNQSLFHELGDKRPWESGTMIVSSLPYFITQLFVANLTYRVFYYLTRPLRLPPFVAQILCGLMFSPSVLGQTEFVSEYVLPIKFTMVLETFANLALVYNIFLLGLNMDLRTIRITELRPVIIAIVGLLLSFPLGLALYYLPGNGHYDKIAAGGLYWTLALVSTNFPDLARTLADLKLLRSEVGRIGMSAAIVTDLSAWVLLVINLASFGKGGTYNGLMPYSLLSTIAFVIICIFAIRPGIAWAFSATVKGGHVGDTHVWFILSGVAFCGFITDACGVHSITGAFLFGLIIPQDHIVREMIEIKLHDFLSGILMPLFYIICGLRADVKFMFQYMSGAMLAFNVFAIFLLKFSVTFVTSIFMKIDFRDGMALGALMNSKGTMALVILNAGRDTKSLDNIMYTQMTFVFLALSLTIQPILSFTYKPKKKLVFYKHRTLQKIKGESQLRVLTCVHVLPNVSGITNLLQISNPTKKSPLNVFAIHLVELTGRTAASMLIMNDENKPKANFSDRVRAESEQIAEAFESMEVNNKALNVQTITAVSPYGTMHEDICSLAEDKRVSIILLPYHKQLTPDGRLGEGNASHAEINQNVLSHAPCSVAILVDRGMTLARSDSFQGEVAKREVAMLFVGGRDDREALAYAWRMAGQQMIKLTVVRFVPGHDALRSAKEAAAQYEKEKIVDDESIYEFNFKTMNDSSVTYTEKVVNDGQETISEIRDMEGNNSFDLYIVGRGYKVESLVTAGLSDWSSSPELGTIGDTLASSNFTMNASVLVVQQYSAAINGNKQGSAEKGGNNEAKPFVRSMYEEEEEDEQSRNKNKK